MALVDMRLTYCSGSLYAFSSSITIWIAQVMYPPRGYFLVFIFAEEF